MTGSANVPDYPDAPRARPSGHRLPGDLAAEVRATAQAAHDLGPGFDDALAESLADKVQRELEHRRAPQAPATPAPQAVSPGSGPQLALAIVSLGVGIPLTAIAANASGLNPLIGVLVVWIGIVLVNIVFNRGAGNR